MTAFISLEDLMEMISAIQDSEKRSERAIKILEERSAISGKSKEYEFKKHQTRNAMELINEWLDNEEEDVIDLIKYLKMNRKRIIHFDE